MADDSKEKKRSQFSLPEQDMRWWREARFGMFVHWGLYSISGRGEWVMWNERICHREYRKLMERFEAKKFNANEWAACARDAGAKYMVLTARHHDGFCLFDSKADDFTSVNSAAKRDFIAEYVKACRKAGLRVGLYFSPLDWRFPGYFFPDLYRESAEAMKQLAYDQIRELLTNYGKIDILWFDGGGDDWLGFGGIEYGGSNEHGWHNRDKTWPQSRHYGGEPLWQPDELYAMIRKLQPKIVMNDRAGSLGVDWEGDFYTPEGRIGEYNTSRAWETCDRLTGSWGHIPGQPMRSLRNCVQLLANVAMRDGNLLLNVGPDGAGEIEPRHVRRLAQVGDWLASYGESIYGTRGGPYKPASWGGSTHRNNHIYIHITDWVDDTVIIPPLKQRILKGRVLTCGNADIEQKDGAVYVSVPEAERQAADTIVVLETERPVNFDDAENE